MVVQEVMHPDHRRTVLAQRDAYLIAIDTLFDKAQALLSELPDTLAGQVSQEALTAYCVVHVATGLREHVKALSDALEADDLLRSSGVSGVSD